MNLTKAQNKAKVLNSLCKNTDITYRALGAADSQNCIVGQYYRNDLVGVAAY